MKLIETDFDRFYEAADKANKAKTFDGASYFNYADFKANGYTKYKDALWGKRGLYLMINTDNNHKYIGQSIDLYDRLQGHYQDAFAKDAKDLWPIDCAIKLHGLEAFTIYYVYVDDDLDAAEIAAIDEYGTYRNRDDYNLTIGGSLVNYERKSIFYNRTTKSFDREALNKVRDFLSNNTLSYPQLLADLMLPMEMKGAGKESDIYLPLSPDKAHYHLLKNINECNGIYRLNEYEQTIYTKPLGIHKIGTNKYAPKDFYIFNLNTPNDKLIPENKLAGPFTDVYETIDELIKYGVVEAKNQRRQIQNIAKGLASDGNELVNKNKLYVYKGYKIKSFEKEQE